MDANKITIERNSSGIYADAELIFPSGPQRVTIWAKPGRYANEYRSKSDDELRAIAAAEYSSMAAAALGRKGGSATSRAKTKSSRANGRKGGRPRKNKTE